MTSQTFDDQAAAPAATSEHDLLANTCLVELPREWAAFLGVRGPMQFAPIDARQFRRAFCRGYAVIRRGAAHTVVITCDVSGGGLSFLHHDQLHPGDEVEIFLPQCAPIALQIARCTKRGPRCFICGARAKGHNDRQALITLVRACAIAQGR